MGFQLFPTSDPLQKALAANSMVKSSKTYLQPKQPPALMAIKGAMGGAMAGASAASAFGASGSATPPAATSAIQAPPSPQAPAQTQAINQSFGVGKGQNLWNWGGSNVYDPSYWT